MSRSRAIKVFLGCVVFCALFKSFCCENELDRESDVQMRNVFPGQRNVGEADSLRGPAVAEKTLEKILEAAEGVSGKKCKSDLALAVNGIRRQEHWALEMYDASVKEPSGIEFGDTYQFGSFDECLSAFHGKKMLSPKKGEGITFAGQPTFSPKYCLADVYMQGYSIAVMSSRTHQFQNDSGTKIFWGLCLPDSCSSADASVFLASATGHNVTVRPGLCTSEERDLSWSRLEVIFVCFIGGFLAIVLFCTCYDGFLGTRSNLKKSRKSTLEEIFAAFSLTENAKKLVRVGSDELGLGCVNGIKGIAMILIILGHSLVFMIGGPVQNSEFYEKQAKLVQNAFFLNSPLLVDTFLLLSGLLFARLIMLELEKRKGAVNFGLLYIFRYIRLTPAYFAVIAFYTTVLPRLGSGPLWNYRIGMEQERCQSSWWANLLYINNYVGTDKLCMFQSWYLSADTQLFILAPLILYPLWKSRRVGIGLLIAATLATTLIPFVVTLVQKIDPTFLVYADEITDLSANTYFATNYIKTHMRATAYVFGLLTGFLIHVMQEKNTRLSKRLQGFLWATALIAGIGSMFSVTIFYYPEYKYSHLESALYAGLHRLGWSYFTGWVVLACVTGYAGRLRRFFVCRALVPVSRLTYCAYLTNGLVELYHASSVRTAKYLNIMNLTTETLGHLALTFFAALILCLLFESPIHGIEKILLRRDSQKRMMGEVNPLNKSPSSSTSEESMSSS